MAAVTSTASDLIVGALRNLNVLAAGEPLNSNDSADALQVLNDLIESLSTEKLFIFTPNNYTLAWTPGQYSYTIGNPTQGTFTGYTASGSPLIYGITNLGSLNITFGLNGNGVQVGGTLTDVQNAIPSGATIVSANFGTTTNITFTAPPTGNTATVSGWAGGAVSGLLTFSDNETRPASISALGAAAWSVALTGTPTASGNQINTNTITMSANATQTLSAADSITYTAPGNFAIPRPLRIRPGFTRITSSGSTSGLDYWYDVTSFDDYVEIGYKGQPGP
jgi:hypothetical protein